MQGNKILPTEHGVVTSHNVRVKTRLRVSNACLSCKASRRKCDEYRPCSSCLKSRTRICTDQEVHSIQKASYIDAISYQETEPGSRSRLGDDDCFQEQHRKQARHQLAEISGVSGQLFGLSYDMMNLVSALHFQVSYIP
jgi:hypothetical protein